MPTQLRVSRYQGTGFRQRLKEATGIAHRGLEARLPLLDKGLTVTQYRLLLRSFYGFYVPLESAMEACPIPALRADLACRRKSWWLLNDLLSLGESHQAIGILPLCHEIPPITCQADLLGALYVVEGATLGGQIILKSLRRSLGRQADQQVRFFTSYGAQVPQMWAAFLRIIEAGAYDEVQEQMIMQSACRTFTAFEQWLAMCEDPSMRSTHCDIGMLHAS
jgi:heme oxygenase (biliverdin-IX-beta and delta-forming)